jgi:hypothetical protein
MSQDLLRLHSDESDPVDHIGTGFFATHRVNPSAVTFRQPDCEAEDNCGVQRGDQRVSDTFADAKCSGGLCCSCCVRRSYLSFNVC